MKKLICPVCYYNFKWYERGTTYNKHIREEILKELSVIHIQLIRILEVLNK